MCVCVLGVYSSFSSFFYFPELYLSCCFKISGNFTIWFTYGSISIVRFFIGLVQLVLCFNISLFFNLILGNGTLKIILSMSNISSSKYNLFFFFWWKAGRVSEAHLNVFMSWFFFFWLLCFHFVHIILSWLFWKLSKKLWVFSKFFWFGELEFQSHSLKVDRYWKLLCFFSSQLVHSFGFLASINKESILNILKRISRRFHSPLKSPTWDTLWYCHSTHTFSHSLKLCFLSP